MRDVDHWPAGWALALPVLAAVAAAFLANGCGDGGQCTQTVNVGMFHNTLNASDAGADGAAGDNPADFCDSHNPCSTDVNCTPCSVLPPDVPPTIYNCTPDGELPDFCRGLVGCAHMARTTPQGQINDCFPVVDDAGPPTSGVCLSGVCVQNPP